MSFIDTIPPEAAEGATLAMYRQLQGRRATLPNYARVYCYRPGVMAAWSELQESIKETVDQKRYALITLAAARALGSSYCALAFAKKLLRHHFDARELENILLDRDPNPLSVAEREMLRVAAKVVRDSASVSREDIQSLRDSGLSDPEIFDVVTAAAARCFFAKVSDALGAQPDADYADLPESLLPLLVVGRDIDSGEEAGTAR